MPTNDLIFSYQGMLNFMPDLKRDMLMLQNQLPMLLLEKLVYVETAKEKKQLEDFLNKTIVKFCSPSQRFRNIGPCLYILDVYRKSLLQDPLKKFRDLMHKHSTKESTGDIIRSVMELHEAGIRFKVSKTRSLEDIRLRGGVLSLPIVVVDDTTETTFLNLMANGSILRWAEKLRLIYFSWITLLIQRRTLISFIPVGSSRMLLEAIKQLLRCLIRYRKM
ncbi:hypothetical protein GIB67_037756 [Kingdonia uniflora]|uniref:Uncharacterized protein n=1 Tax=Kingdonia uniflora TaxID=39325 RepID=A0A7J7LUX2_9MAGN|nr:hypothetical protein GIB67_037756 [Kingdonia uniflora]